MFLIQILERQLLSEPGDELTEDLRDTYRRNWTAIRTHEHHYKLHSAYNFMVDRNDVIGLLKGQDVNEIFNRAADKFKINASIGFLLYQKSTDKHRYFHASQNFQRILKNPPLISDRDDFEQFIASLSDTDFLQKAIMSRPDTSWVVRRVTNVAFFKYPIFDHPIGTAPSPLPEYLIRNRGLTCLDRDSRGNPYTDHLCIFRCVCLHMGKASSLETNTKFFASQYIDFLDDPSVTLENFPGILLRDLHCIEDLFQISICVYDIREDGRATLVRRSTGRYPVMYLNLNDGHFSYVSHLERYTKSFRCPACDKLWKTGKSLNRHYPCTNKRKEYYPGGFYKQNKNVFELLDDEGFEIEQSLRYYDYMACYDAEAYFVKSDLPSDTESTSYTAAHELASLSVSSNVEGFLEPKCFVSEGDSYLLVSDMMVYLTDIRNRATELLMDRFERTLHDLDIWIDRRMKAESIATSKVYLPQMDRESKLSKYRKMLLNHIGLLPVWSYYGGKYDLQLLRPYLMRYLIMAGDGKNLSLIKKGNDYKSLKTPTLHFLDVTSYLSPGFSLAQYLKAFNTGARKLYFPYEWLDSLDKLDCDELPPISAFFSSLKNQGITEDQYKECQEIWSSNGMTTFRDFLIHYNNRFVLVITPWLPACPTRPFRHDRDCCSDTQPLIIGLCRQRDYYKSKGLDFARDAISIPGMSELVVGWSGCSLSTPM